VNVKAVLVVAIAIGLVFGIASAPQAPPTSNESDKLAELLKPDPLLEVQFNAGVRQLRLLEQTEREQAGNAVNPAIEAALRDGRSLTMGDVVRPSDNPVSMTGAYPERSAGSISLRRHMLDQPSASRAFLEQQRLAASSGHLYRGASGAKYRYDLGNPSDNLRYSVDSMTQLRDSMSIDPRREMDQSIGQYGGGIQR
jgi:hypothetical protein